MCPCVLGIKVWCICLCLFPTDCVVSKCTPTHLSHYTGIFLTTMHHLHTCTCMYLSCKSHTHGGAVQCGMKRLPKGKHAYTLSLAYMIGTCVVFIHTITHFSFIILSSLPPTFSSPPPLTRCHTFGIGPEVCVELVNGIAAASGGQCVLLAEGERLQTKVCTYIYICIHMVFTLCVRTIHVCFTTDTMLIIKLCEFSVSLSMCALVDRGTPH